MSHDYTLAKKSIANSIAKLLQYFSKINLAVLFVRIFAKSTAIHVAIPQKVLRYFIIAILYRDINNPGESMQHCNKILALYGGL